MHWLFTSRTLGMFVSCMVWFAKFMGFRVFYVKILFVLVRERRTNFFGGNMRIIHACTGHVGKHHIAASKTQLRRSEGIGKLMFLMCKPCGVYLNFLNFLINDSIYLLDESLNKILELKEIEAKMTNTCLQFIFLSTYFQSFEKLRIVVLFAVI
ncbi:hypothetical protein ACJX0J_008015 [Zea mays]